MLRKTIEIATPGTRLSVAHRQLAIERPDQPKATTPIEEIGVLIVDDRRASYTQAVFTELLAAGATVLVTGPDHLPMGMMLPLAGHHEATARHHAQIEASEPRRKRLWQALIAAKLRQQGAALDFFGVAPNGLAEMATHVRSGDPDNLEAQGAQRYWPLLFGKNFRRDREAAGVNAALNYGYAILRAALARALVASGLLPSLGLFHKNRSNPFCLADDLFEPFRPYVDWRVKHLTIERGEALDLSDRTIRVALLSLLNETIWLAGRRLPLLLALDQAAAALAGALTEPDGVLVLPSGMPLDPEPEDETEPDS